MKKTLPFILIFALALFMIQNNSYSSAKDTKMAKAASITWLKVVDNGNYENAYDMTCQYFKNAVKKDKLVASLTAVRKPLGKVRKRKMTKITYSKKMAGMPDGEYYVIIYKTSFTKKKQAFETVVMMKDQGVWKLAGYWIK